MRTISPRSYHPDVHDSDMQDTPRAPSGFLGRDHSPSSVHNYRDPLSHYRSNARESNDRFASTRDNRQSTSSSESSNDDNEQRKDGTGSVRSPWRDSFVLEQRRQSIQSYFNRGSPLPPYALDAPAFTLSRRPSQNWVHPGNRMTDDNGVTTIPLEFRPMQSTPVVEDRVRISGLPRDTIGDGDHQDHRRYHGSRSLAGIQAYYPYPHPDFLRLPAPLGEPRGKSGHTTSTQRVPPRLRTSQACEKCRKRKVKCTGDRPTCGRCAVRGFICEYATTEREDKYKNLFLKGPEKARHERRMRSSDYYGQDPSVATTNIPSDNDSDRRPSDSSTSSEESAFYNIGMGHAQHEERRYLVYPNNSGPGMGYASSIRVQGFEETDQPSYRRLSVKDLLNPRPSTPQMSLLSVGNTDFSRLVYETQAHLRELHGNLKATEPIQGRDLEGQFGRERERGGVVVKFPSTFPRITQDRLPVMVASEVLPVDPSSVVPSQTGDVHSQSQSPARSSSSPSAMDSSPPSSHVSGSQASGARKTSPGRDDLKSSGSAAGTRRIGEGHRSHVVRGGNLCGIKGNKDNQGDDSSVSSHGQSPRSEVESE